MTFESAARAMERDIHRLVHAVVPFARRETEMKLASQNDGGIALSAVETPGDSARKSVLPPPIRPGGLRAPHPSGERGAVSDPTLGARPEAIAVGAGGRSRSRPQPRLGIPSQVAVAGRDVPRRSADLLPAVSWGAA